MIKLSRLSGLLLLLVIPSLHSFAQQPLSRYTPSHEEIVQRYHKSKLLDSLTKKTVFRHNVDAHWLPGDTAFCYLAGNPDGDTTMYLVNASSGQKTIVADSLRKTRLLATGIVPELIRAHEPVRWDIFETDATSPDKQWKTEIINGNVYVKSLTTNAVTALTNDADTSRSYYGALAWSPDSRCFIGYKVRPVTDSSVFYVLSDVPGTTRGQLRSQSYKQPGDPFTTWQMLIFDPATRKVTPVKEDAIDFLGTPVLHWRHQQPGYFVYEKVDRGHQRFRVIEVNTTNGNTRTILEERTSTFIYESRLYTHYLPETNEMLLTSEKDGWRHIYLVNTLTGTQHQITKGPWVVRGVDSVDAVNREIWFRASGRNEGEDPYFVHHYRISFDGKKLLALTPDTGDHLVFFSPGRKYYIDKYSQVNVPPVNELRRTADGKLVATLEHADVSAWRALGVPFPEPFKATGRDGKTDIWGIVCRPSNFDTTKMYPVIENIYAGPQDAFVPKSFMSYYTEMQALADMGFIVVQIDGMGTANRSKAFHDVCWKNLADAGFPDRIRWIKALAEKYPFVDTSRVGIYGTSAGGQNALGGLLFHPEFYKAGVASCGCHDNRIDKQWWNEQWMGYPVGKHYDEQSNVTNAEKLKGSLLLIVGEADTNVPPESTYRVASALIKSGKTFEFLPLPGIGHTSGGTYGRQRRCDFFVRHLLQVTPPDINTNE
ncbi:prolyl oligopeptidase family serine peptidase [Chitinophaga sp. 212800010-3]|uniref:S9 family peptidase n=1 Tax=unclassified Chitinophaga TaxID=2619133 RepID=UPI002DE41FDE|nr:Dipeptidyl aminopeptidase/acylaminoacyl peptidase [Chitinophaga sp. 212800010-3]